MKRVVLIALLSIISCQLIAQVGTWRAYMSYYEPQQIVKAQNTLFVLASNDLYQYNLNDHSITTYDKITGLSDTYITHIAWNQEAKRLIVVYQNSNIDLIDANSEVTNISSLYSKSMTEDKTVDSITVDGPYAYLYARFGIVKVNMQRGEISDTYRPNHPEYPTSLPASHNDWDEYIDIVKTLSPDGPKYNYFNHLRYEKGKIISTGGGWKDGGEFTRPFCVQILDEDNKWQIIDQLEPYNATRLTDATSPAYDPNDKTHLYVATCGSGLYEFRNGQMVANYTDGNSPILSAIEDNFNYVRVDGLIFDNSGYLWMSCSAEAYNKDVILRLNPSTGEWKTYNNEQLFYDGTLLKILRHAIKDENGNIWMANDHHEHPCLIRINPSEETMTRYDTFVNQDNTDYTLNYIHALTQDIDGNLWIGSDQGLFMYDQEQKADPTKGFTQIKVPRNDGTNYADYLLSGIEITAIAVDAGNRKWIGTDGNGVYLISADNMEQLQHFTTDNSKLLSNSIESIAINESTGEVFFGTGMGLCSYMSDASTAVSEMTKDNAYAYPNPVTPDYQGLITITGLSFDADVKITSSNGALIAEGRSNGGMFTWDGCDKQGRRVASGVYMVITATKNGDKGTVCKIAVIN